MSAWYTQGLMKEWEGQGSPDKRILDSTVALKLGDKEWDWSDGSRGGGTSHLKESQLWAAGFVLVQAGSRQKALARETEETQDWQGGENETKSTTSLTFK